MDVFSPSKRSEIMARVRSKNTRPELAVRSGLHRMGFRFRLHRADLPGHPDIVLPRFKAAVFVHGCFWHGHPNCRHADRPTSNIGFWNKKIDRNISRDRTNRSALKRLGWTVVTVWECSIRSREGLRARLNQIGRDLRNRRRP